MIRKNSELFIYIQEIAKSGNYFIEEVIPRRQQIIVQNSNTFYAYIIKKGIAKCYLTEETGNDFIQEFFSEGELFGEIEIINDNKSFCTIEAISDMVVYKISKVDFKYLLQNDKKFNTLILKSFSRKIQYKALRHSHNQLNSIKRNLLRLQEATSNFRTIISKRDIASYLGISLRSLNRILKEGELNS